MKQVKIFSETCHSALEDAINEYLRDFYQYEVDVKYYFPSDSSSNIWTAVVEIEKPIFRATNSKELKEVVKGFKSEGIIVEVPNHVFKIEEEAFSHENNLGGVMLPDRLLDIDNWAFCGCANLREVNFPGSVKSIGYGAFRECYSLRKVEVPFTVTSIGQGNFTNAKTIKVDPRNQVYDSRDNCNAIIETATNTLISGCENTIIPPTVTKIADSAFACCLGLREIEIPNSVTIIEDYAFADCRRLESVKLPNILSYIGECTFSQCFMLRKIEIPGSVKEIDSSAFQSTYSIAEIHIRIRNLAGVEFGSNNDCFSDINHSYCTIYVPKGTKDTYRSHPAFEGFKIVEE